MASQVQSCRNVCHIGSGQLINCRGDSGSFEKQGVHGGPGVSKISKSNHPQDGWKNWLLDLFKLGSPAFPKRYQPLDGKDLCRSQKKGPTLPRKPWKTHGTSMEKSLKPVEKNHGALQKSHCHEPRSSVPCCARFFRWVGRRQWEAPGCGVWGYFAKGDGIGWSIYPLVNGWHNYGKSPFQWVNPLFRLGHFQLQTVSHYQRVYPSAQIIARIAEATRQVAGISEVSP